LGRYVAGTWTKDLPLWLTWSVDHDVDHESSRNKAFIALSWSWASMKAGRVIRIHQALFHLHYPAISHLQILDIACKPTGLDPLGAIESGYLTLRGRAVSAELFPAPKSVEFLHPRFIVRHEGWEIVIEYDCPSDLSASSHLFTPQIVHCLLICSRQEKYWGVYTVFLVLSTEGCEDGYYRRCGICHIYELYLTENCNSSPTPHR
jgi:hypothetical protein